MPDHIELHKCDCKDCHGGVNICRYEAAAIVLNDYVTDDHKQHKETQATIGLLVIEIKRLNDEAQHLNKLLNATREWLMENNIPAALEVLNG